MVCFSIFLRLEKTHAGVLYFSDCHLSSVRFSDHWSILEDRVFQTLQLLAAEKYFRKNSVVQM